MGTPEMMVAIIQVLKSPSKNDVEIPLANKQRILFCQMHGWKDRFAEQNLWDALSYVRTLAPFNPVG